MKSVFVVAAIILLAIFVFAHQYRIVLTSKDLNTTEKKDSSHDDTFVAHQKTTADNQHHNGPLCLSLDQDKDMDNLLEKYKQVFIFYPAKAAGTTYDSFTVKCMKSKGIMAFTNIHLIHDKKAMLEVIDKQLELPTLLSLHIIYSNQPIIDALKHNPHNVLIIYSHREETSRLISAIRHVVALRYCEYNKKLEGNSTKKEGVIFEQSKCYVKETTLIQIIKKKISEINYGQAELLTCSFYNAVKESGANLVFVDYTKTNEVLKLLSKHHCNQTESNLHKNSASSNEIHIILNNNDQNRKNCTLNDWLKSKTGLLSYLFDLQINGSCQGKTRDIEDALLKCPDKAIQISGYSYNNQKAELPFE